MSSTNPNQPDDNHRPRRNSSERRRVRQLERLTQASNDIIAHLGRLPLQEMLDYIARRAVELLRAEAGSILLVSRPGVMTLVADHGFRRRLADQGWEFLIRSGAGLGLTGHVAHTGQLFNECGQALNSHWAVNKQGRPETHSGQCYSLLMLPFFDPESGQLQGVLRVENKKNAAGRPDPGRCFPREDEWLIGWLASVVLAATRHATWHAQLIDQLQREQDHVARLTTGAPYAIIAIDAHGNVTAYNPEAQKIHGYTFEEVRGRRVDFLYKDLEEAMRVNRLLHEAPDGRVDNIEATVRAKPDDYHPAGETIDVRLDVTVLRDAAGDVVGSVGYFQDLRAIKDIERRLALLLEAGGLVAHAESLDEALDRLERLLQDRLRVPFSHIFLRPESDALPTWAFRHADGATATGEPADAATAGGDGPPARLLDPFPDEHLGGGAFCAGSAHALDFWQRRLRLPAGLRSLLHIPLRSRGHVVGLLVLGDRRPHSPALFRNTAHELAVAVADQTAALIDSLRLQAETRRHRDLLKALDRAALTVRAERHPAQLRPEIVRLAAELVGFDVGALYGHTPHLRTLTLEAVYNLPLFWKYRQNPLAGDLISRVVATGRVAVARHHVLRAPTRPAIDAANLSDDPAATEALAAAEAGHDAVVCAEAVALPLRSAGEVVAVLVVGRRHAPDGRPDDHRLHHADLEILHSFASHASLALRIAQLMGEEQRTFRQLDVLEKISRFMQSTDDPAQRFLALLTGITAGYGLRFNRAALFLRDAAAGYFVCRAAIGPIDAEAARADWALSLTDDLFNIGNALDAIDERRITLVSTPLGQRMLHTTVPLVGTTPGDVLADAIEGVCRVVTPDELAGLPDALWRAFDPDPTLPLVIAPLLVRGRAIGFVVADNRITRAPIGEDDRRMLFTYAGAGAVAIDSARRQDAQAIMRRAADELARAKGMADVLAAIVRQARQVLKAHSTAFWYYDHATHHFILEHSVADGISDEVWDEFRNAAPQPNQTAFTVLERGWLGVEDVTDAGRYPFLGDTTRAHLARIGVQSMQGVTLSLGDQPLGVLYANYDRRRAFSPEAAGVMRAFAEHAAPALEKAWLMEQQQRAAETDHVIAQVMAAANLDQALQAIVEGARKVLRCGPVTLYVFDPGRDQLRYPPAVAGLKNPAGVRRLTAVKENSIILDFLRQGGDDPIIIDRLDRAPRFANSRFTRDESIVTLAAVVLKVAGDRVGILFVNYRSEHRFTGDEVAHMKHFAAQAAVAIRMAQYRELTISQDNALRAVQAVGRLGLTLHDRDQVLAAVAEQAWRLFPGARYASVSLAEDDRLPPVAAYPPQRLPALGRLLAARRLNGDGRIGVTARAFLDGVTRRVPDVSRDDDHIPLDGPAEGSELVAIIAIGEEKLGVLNVEHPIPHAFQSQDEPALEALAHEAGAAMAITRHLNEQARVNRKLVESKTRLAAVMSLGVTELMLKNWVHTFDVNLQEAVKTLAETLAVVGAAQEAGRHPVLLQAIREQLDLMDAFLRPVLNSPLVTRQLDEKGPVTVHQLYHDYVEGLGHDRMGAASIPIHINCPDHPAWRVNVGLQMQVILDGLVANAFEAMRDRPDKHVTFSAQLAEDGEHIHLLIHDTGKGIDAELLPRLFVELLPAADDKPSHGIGLFMARVLLEELYNGTINVAATGPTGTTMLIVLPIDRA